MDKLTESDWLQNILTDAGWEQIAANRWRRPDDQEFSTTDAIRVLSGLPALECGTTWPLPSDAAERYEDSIGVKESR